MKRSAYYCTRCRFAFRDRSHRRRWLQISPPSGLLIASSRCTSIARSDARPASKWAAIPRRPSRRGSRSRSRKVHVEFHYVDFQDKKNAALTKGYKVSGPALIVAKVKANKVKEFKDLKDIWTKVREKPEFLKYVRENVEAYLK